MTGILKHQLDDLLPRPCITLIAAMARDRTIGVNNRLPWRLKADLQHFKAATLGHTVVMGRKTWESLPGKLPGRRCMVLSQQPGFIASGAETFGDILSALHANQPATDIFIIGGAQLYQQFLPIADRLLITEVDADITGDAWFPEISTDSFQENKREHHSADQDNQYDFDFVDYIRVTA